MAVFSCSGWANNLINEWLAEGPSNKNNVLNGCHSNDARNKQTNKRTNKQTKQNKAKQNKTNKTSCAVFLELVENRPLYNTFIIMGSSHPLTGSGHSSMLAYVLLTVVMDRWYVDCEKLWWYVDWWWSTNPPPPPQFSVAKQTPEDICSSTWERPSKWPGDFGTSTIHIAS